MCCATAWTAPRLQNPFAHQPHLPDFQADRPALLDAAFGDGFPRDSVEPSEQPGETRPVLASIVDELARAGVSYATKPHDVAVGRTFDGGMYGRSVPSPQAPVH